MECELCGNKYNFLRQHLVKAHRVANKDELALLMKSATGRGVTGHLLCLVCKKWFVRLDKHFQSAHEDVTDEKKSNLIQLARKNRVIKDLRALRATNPAIPMVSSLDILEEEMSRDVHSDPPAGPSDPAAGPSSYAPAGSSGAAAVPSSAPSSDARPGCRVRDDTIRGLRNLLICKRVQQSKAKMPWKKYSKKRQPEVNEENVPGFEDLLARFYKRITTKGATAREASNTQQRVQAVRQFLLASAGGEVPRKDLRYLTDNDRITVAVDSWKAKGLKPTTIKKKLTDVSVFFKWVGSTWPQGVRLSTKTLAGLKDAISVQLRNIAPDVVSHVQAVRRHKSDAVIDVVVHRSFIQRANKTLLKYFQNVMTQKSQEALQRFFGLLAGLIVAETGHRITVLTNMLSSEVEAARKAGSCYVIYVKQYKTRRTYRDAWVPVDAWVYGIMAASIKFKDQILEEKSKYYFSSSSGGKAALILPDFKRGWLDLGMPEPPPTFNSLRCSTATYALRLSDYCEADEIATLMCHDIQTSKKFYKADPPPKDTVRVREFMLNAIRSGARERRMEERGDLPPIEVEEEEQVCNPQEEEEEEELRQGEQHQKKRKACVIHDKSKKKRVLLSPRLRQGEESRDPGEAHKKPKAWRSLFHVSSSRPRTPQP